MILVWNNAQSFHRHLEAMKVFRQSHGIDPGDSSLLNDMPTIHEINPPRKEKTFVTFTDSKGKLILVPIWKISAPPGTQN